MRAWQRRCVLSILLLLVIGCCKIIPSLPGCDDNDGALTFNFRFTNNRTSWCQPEISVKWRVYAQLNDGTRIPLTERSTPPGESDIINDFGEDDSNWVPRDDNRDGNFDDRFECLVNLTCRPDAPESEWGGTLILEPNTLPIGGTWIVTLSNEDIPTQLVEGPSAAAQAAAVVKDIVAPSDEPGVTTAASATQATSPAENVAPSDRQRTVEAEQPASMASTRTKAADKNADSRTTVPKRSVR